jgi:hypothetical protein
MGPQPRTWSRRAHSNWDRTWPHANATRPASGTSSNARPHPPRAGPTGDQVTRPRRTSSSDCRRPTVKEPRSARRSATCAPCEEQGAGQDSGLSSQRNPGERLDGGHPRPGPSRRYQDCGGPEAVGVHGDVGYPFGGEVVDECVVVERGHDRCCTRPTSCPRAQGPGLHRRRARRAWGPGVHARRSRVSPCRMPLTPEPYRPCGPDSKG